MPKEDNQDHQGPDDNPEENNKDNRDKIVKDSDDRLNEMRPFIGYTFMDLLPYITPFNFRNQKEEDTLSDE